MPSSSHDFRIAIAEYLWTFPRQSNVIDIGAGEGTYYDLLGGHFFKMDAVEVWEPYVRQYGLLSKYHRVYMSDVCNLRLPKYDIAIIGGTLEHLSVACATNVLNRLCDDCIEVIVKVPYNTPQGAVGGNRWEVHIQHDLTHERMLKRYPRLEGWLMNDKCGVYRKGK